MNVGYGEKSFFNLEAKRKNEEMFLPVVEELFGAVVVKY
jgi:hypothetical protein